MTEYLVIEASRTAYSPSQVKQTMTVGELIELLSEYNEYMPVVLSHDNGYTYGGIMQYDFDTKEVDED